MWMLLHSVRFTLNGDECNKIGVGYEAFNQQPNFCSSPFWSCLHNQLWNYHEVGTGTIISFSLTHFHHLAVLFYFLHFLFTSFYAAVWIPYMEYFFRGILFFNDFWAMTLHKHTYTYIDLWLWRRVITSTNVEVALFEIILFMSICILPLL